MLQRHTGGALLCHSLGRSSFWSQTLELGPSQELAALGLDLIPETNTLKKNIYYHLKCICGWGVVFVPLSVKRTTLLTQFSPSIFRRVLGIKLRLLSWCHRYLYPLNHLVSILYAAFYFTSFVPKTLKETLLSDLLSLFGFSTGNKDEIFLPVCIQPHSMPEGQWHRMSASHN